jgi:hypothetical protein
MDISARRPPTERESGMRIMRTTWFALGALVIMTIAGARPVFVAGQTPTKATGTATTGTSPRSADGHRNLEGLWTSADAGVPFAAAPWTPPAPRVALPRIGWGVQPGERPRERARSNRIALVVDPPDGKIPAYTSAGQKRMDALAEYRRQHDNGNLYDSWEDVGLASRCITSGVPGAMRGSFQIVQGPGMVSILYDLKHDVRVIPLDGRPHTPSSVRSWLGDSRGHWEGNTLVVDVVNFRSPASFTGSPWETDYIPISDRYHVVERFTRVDSERLEYRATIEDPDTFTKPFSIMMMLKPDHEVQEIYEDACHEGNRGLEGVLSASRAVEKKKTAEGGGKKE